MKKGLKRVLSAILLTCYMWTSVVLPVRATMELGEYDLYAKAAVLMDGESGRVLYEKNGDQVMPMASTTKIMTCIVALENAGLEEEVEVSAYAASQPKVHLGMKKGTVYRLGDLLYSLMLESHNDTAVAIAEHIGAKSLQLHATTQRSVEESKQAVSAFATLMNAKAKELGCENTWYITPNGLDASQQLATESGSVEKIHSTTAEELALVMRYCAWESPHKEEFLEITRQRSYSFADVSGSRSHTCTNHNSFLDMMDGALTGKTGFTNAAGYCYVGALEREGKKYTVALLACGWPNNKSWKWSDTRRLMEYGLKNYELCRLEDFVCDQSELPALKVEEGQTDRLGEQASTGLRIKIQDRSEFTGMLLGEHEKVEVTVKLPKNLQAPVSEGMQVGLITYSLNGENIFTEQIVASRSIDKIDFSWCLEKILGIFFLGR
ncbi:MAG: D-alanyl-D-alanine carboxypeptidase [Lachnospiraceae bacterium]|nr:D-alanyl-D-alanine carboxypeptidase [Lachnospiraceae bacterium]